MSLLIKKPGILTTVQDLGRFGYRRIGINPGGAMDATAARIANLLVGNDENAPLLETHFPAAQIMFKSDTRFAITGADLAATLDDQPVDNWTSHLASPGSELRFTSRLLGSRAYLAVEGGLDVEQWLGSASTNLAACVGGYQGRRLIAGDEIAIAATLTFASRDARVSSTLVPRYSSFPTVRIIRGAEYDLLDDAAKGLLVDHDFSLSNNSNRMGYRLSGDALKLAETHEFISAAVDIGTIQLLPDGQLIVLMADRQTAGGYPRLAHVITADLPLMGQAGPGDKVAFHMIDLSEAEAISAAFERELSFLRVGCRFQQQTSQ